MNTENKQRGLLAHSSKAAEEREKFMDLRLPKKPETVSDGQQMKYFLLYSRAGVTCAFGFAALIFFSGIAG